jgi:hypothetical protein
MQLTRALFLQKPDDDGFAGNKMVTLTKASNITSFSAEDAVFLAGNRGNGGSVRSLN